MLGRVVEERQQLVLVVRDPLDDLGVLRAVLLGEGGHRLRRVLLVLGVVDVLDRALGRGLRGLWQGVQAIGCFVNPTPLVTGGGEDLVQRVPEAECAVADGQHRGAHAAANAVAEQAGPRLGRFAVAVGHRDQFLRAIRPHAHQHQHRGLRLFQADAQVHAVGPDVDVVGARQVAILEGGVISLPLRGQPRHRRRGQAGRGAEELLERGHEVAGGQTMQVKQRQHLADLRGLAAPRRQDRRGEPPTLATPLVNALVVDARRLDLDRPGGSGDLPRLVKAVAHHQATARRVALISQRG
jgi:hypothetical protein